MNISVTILQNMYFLKKWQQYSSAWLYNLINLFLNFKDFRF